jgi:hypothetical protein
MDTEKSILKKVAAAIYNGDFNAFEQTILPLLNFEDADENNAPTTSNPDLSMLLENFCDADASYDENHLDLLESPTPYTLCEWVDQTQDPSPCADYDEWEWENSPEFGLYLTDDEDSYEHFDLVSVLFEKYEDEYKTAQQNEWLQAFYYQIREELNVNNVLFYPQGNSIDEDVSNFLHFLPGSTYKFSRMLSRSEYKFLLEVKMTYNYEFKCFKQSDLYRNAIMLGLASQAIVAFQETFYPQYKRTSCSTVDLASEGNVIKKVALALKSFDDVTTTDITKSDLRCAYCNITYPTLEEIAQMPQREFPFPMILPNGEEKTKLFDTYEISASPMECMCLEELLSHLPYEPEQIIDCIKLCCDSTKCNTVDEIVSQLACNLCDYMPYDEKYCDKDGAYEDIGFHFVEGTDLEKALNQFHATAHFDYISFGRQLAENNAYCVGKYGYIPYQANNAACFHAYECQFSKTDVCTLGLYAAGLLEKYSSLVSSDDKLSPILDPSLAPLLLIRLEESGIVLKDVPDYEQTITTKHEEKLPFDERILDNVVCAYKPPAERRNGTLADDLQAAQAAANRQTRQHTSLQQSHNQKL